MAASDWRAALLAHWQRPRPSALARALQPLSWLYAAAAALHRSLYRVGLRRPRRAPLPLVVVGNLVAGGAGKTPTVIALVDALQRLGRRPGVISRGYGRRGAAVRIVGVDSSADEVGDEPLLIHLRCRVPVAVGSRRIEAARALYAHDPTLDLLIADDGLQHHALARDAQVMVFDSRGAGNALLLPAGPLRQPLPADLPPRSLVLYTDGTASTPLPGFVAKRRLAGAVELAAWRRGEPARIELLHALRGRPLVACAGTAQPERFFDMLRREGLDVRGVALPDHAPWHALAWPAETPDAIVTEKDAVKLHPDAQRGASTRIWVAPLDFELPDGLTPALLALLATDTRPAT